MSANLEAPRLPAPLPYHAETPFGHVQLLLPMSTEAFVDDSAAVAAVRLVSVEALLQALDDWLADTTGPLSWQWAHPPTQAPFTVTLRNHVLDAQLDLPWPLLRRAGPPPTELRAQIDWPTVEAAALLDRFDLDNDDTSALEPGGVVLLPGSFGAADGGPWLSAPDGITTPTHPAPPVGAWSVTCPLAQACDLPHAAGWDRFDRHLALTRHAQLWHGLQLCATGELIPWGQGQALRLLSLAPQPTPD